MYDMWYIFDGNDGGLTCEFPLEKVVYFMSNFNISDFFKNKKPI